MLYTTRRIITIKQIDIRTTQKGREWKRIIDFEDRVYGLWNERLLKDDLEVNKTYLVAVESVGKYENIIYATLDLKEV